MGGKQIQKASDITIGLNLQTGHMKNMLKAIAKHADELANEIDIIQNTTCSQCGGKLIAQRITPDKKYVIAHCNECDKEDFGFYKAQYFDVKDLPED